MSVTVRLARPDNADLSAIWAMGRAFHAERAGEAGWPALDPAKAHGEIARCLDKQPCFVAERDGQPIGALLLVLSPYWFAAANVLTDRMFYVSPEHRGSGAAKELIRSAVELAREFRCALMLTTSSGLVGPVVDRFYASLGLRRIGAAYLMEG